MLWQGFDYPSDTLLPLMKIGLNRRSGLNWLLTSWKSHDDPRSGNFSYEIDPTGFPQFIVYKGRTKWFRVGTAIFDMYCLWMAAPGSIHYGYYIISYQFVYVGSPWGKSGLYGRLRDLEKILMFPKMMVYSEKFADIVGTVLVRCWSGDFRY
jgi:hypothetical protein